MPVLAVAVFEVEGFGCLCDHSTSDERGEHHHEGESCPVGERVSDHGFVWFPFAGDESPLQPQRCCRLCARWRESTERS